MWNMVEKTPGLRLYPCSVPRLYILSKVSGMVIITLAIFAVSALEGNYAGVRDDSQILWKPCSALLMVSQHANKTVSCKSTSTN